MSVPNVRVTKSDGNTGVVPPAPDGVLAIIAPSEKGDRNVPATHTSDRRALEQFGDGPLVSYGAIDMGQSGKPALLIRPNTDEESEYGDVTVSGAPEDNASGFTPTASTTPFDDYEVLIEFKTAGTVGVDGITYRTSLDGGRTYSGVKALGTADVIAIPNSGVSFDLEAGKAVAALETVACNVLCEHMSSQNLTDALEALRTCKVPFEAVLIHGETDSTLSGALATWLEAQQPKGRFKTGLTNTRFRDPNTETEAQYLAAMTTETASITSIDLVCGADGARIPDPIRGHELKRPTALLVAARGMKIDLAEDPAYVALGPLTAVTIADDRGNPRDHDEDLFPGLDDIRLTTLRSLEGENGVFINNARLMSSPGSDFVFWQHARVLNAGCENIHATLRKQLSKGVAKDPTTGKILESEASALEGLCQANVEQRLRNRVSGVKVVLSRDDDLSSNAGATLSAELEVSALAYVKGFLVVAKFVRKITASAA